VKFGKGISFFNHKNHLLTPSIIVSDPLTIHWKSISYR